MIRLELIEPSVPFAPNCERTGDSHSVKRLDASQVQVLRGILSRALRGEPRLAHIIPDEQTREAVLPWLVASAVRAGEIYGETFIAPAGTAGAIWIQPGGEPGFRHILRSELRHLPLTLPKALVRRWLSASAWLERIHQLLAVRPHWFLLALAAETSALTNTTAAAVIAPVLQRADFEGVDCYVETFQESTLPFYEEQGFRIQGSGRITKSGPNFWIMMRKPAWISDDCRNER
jgi:hypothetical protein